MSQLPEVRFHPAPTRLVKLLVMSIAFVLVGWLVLWATVNGAFGWGDLRRGLTTTIGYAGIAFGALGACYFIFRLVVRRSSLVIDDDGIVDNATLLSAGPVPWDEVTEVRVQSFGSQRFLVVEVRDEAALLARQPWIKRVLMRVNRTLGGAVVWVPMLAVPVPEEELLAQIGRRRPAS